MTKEKNKVGRPRGTRKRKLCLSIEETFYNHLKVLAEQEHRSIPGQLIHSALIGAGDTKRG